MHWGNPEVTFGHRKGELERRKGEVWQRKGERGIGTVGTEVHWSSGTHTRAHVRVLYYSARCYIKVFDKIYQGF